MNNASENYVLFEVAGATYAIPSASVLHIEMLEHLTPVPNAHRAVQGVVFSRGQVIPAIDLRTRFGFARQEKTLQTRVIFAQLRERVVGLIVDSAREFKKVSASSVRPLQETLTGISGNYLKGLTTLNERLVLILDLDAVLNLEEDQLLANSLDEAVTDGQGKPATA